MSLTSPEQREADMFTNPSVPLMVLTLLFQTGGSRQMLDPSRQEAERLTFRLCIAVH